MKKNLINALLFVTSLSFPLSSCLFLNKNPNHQSEQIIKDSLLEYKVYQANETDIIISRADYFDKLHGFWLAQCIANWTGLVTEMDKIGNIGEIKTGDFYTREDWGNADQPNIWSKEPSEWSTTIDFVFRGEGETWGADDDTDIEYMYQHLLYTNRTSSLTGKQIQEGWLKHMKHEEENFLWVSNQRALDLMKNGVMPPMTSHPDSNFNYDMIDAQLTTEIFGLFAPASPKTALSLAHLPIRTTARENAAWISEFYVIMYSLAANINPEKSMKENVFEMAQTARKRLPEATYSAKMYDFVKSQYEAGETWEAARDAIYQKYQVEQADGYDITTRNMHCNSCFAAGINFAASMISLFYGEGDLVATIKIGVLSGWDSDNPTATWGGMLGFMYGKEGVEKAFNRTFSNQFNIHRTRVNFPKAIDTFENMATIGVFITDRVVQEQMGGGVDLEKNAWYIPNDGLTISVAIE